MNVSTNPHEWNVSQAMCFEWFWRMRAVLPWTHAHAEYLMILERLRFR